MPKLLDGRDRLFFLFNWEGLRERKSLTASPSVPLTAWRTGDFSQLRDASGNLIPIYDPATRVFDAAGNVIQAPTPFPGQRHPGEPHRPGLAAAARLLSAAAAGADRRQLRQRRSPPVDADQFTYRFDFTQSANASWFFRHSFSRELGYDPFAIPDMGINTDTDVQQLVLG